MAYKKYAIPKMRTLKTSAQRIKSMRKIALVLFIKKGKGW